MFEGICQFLDGMGNVDNGVESVLTEQAFDGLTKIIKSVYGQEVLTEFEKMFTQREDGSVVLSMEGASIVFRYVYMGVHS